MDPTGNSGRAEGSSDPSSVELVQLRLPSRGGRDRSGEFGEARFPPRTSDEFAEPLPLGEGAHEGKDETTRRDFLSLVGFSLGAASLAACRAPVQKAIPLPVGSAELTPGVANFYATTCGGCASACGLVVKQRDGRPIKIEGNRESPLFGGTCATGQATVLSLYDNERARGPSWRGRPASWDDIDRRIINSLAEAKSAGRSVVLVSTTISSPTTRDIIAEWGRRYPKFRHVVYDPISLGAVRTANERSFGRAVVPHYRFDLARVIVGFEADFLGTWLSPVEFARAYAKTRRADDTRSVHVQVESGFSVTGANADTRYPVAPSEIGAVVAALYARIAQKAGLPAVPVGPGPVDDRSLDRLAELLWRHPGESLVVSGINDVSVQLLVNAINVALHNIARTVDLARPSLQRQGDDGAMAGLVDEMNRGEVHAIFLYGANPAYDYADGAAFLQGLGRVTLSVSLSDRRDETAARVDAVCPDHHFLESWGDAEPVASYFGLAQPLIRPLFDTRAAPESLLAWIGIKTSHYDYLRSFWKTRLFPRQKAISHFDAFWDQSLQRGFVELPGAPAVSDATTASRSSDSTAPAGSGAPAQRSTAVASPTPRSAGSAAPMTASPMTAAPVIAAAAAPTGATTDQPSSASATRKAPPPGYSAPAATPAASAVALTDAPAAWQLAARALVAENAQSRAARRGGVYELRLYESIAMRDGRNANNPWLLELPDPMTTVTWGNVAALSPWLAGQLGIENGDIVSLRAGTTSIEVPAFVQPGQEGRTVALALGYGRTHAGKAGNNVGVNAFPLAPVVGGYRRYSATNVSIARTGKQATLAATQKHFSTEDRPIVLETSVAELRHHDRRGGPTETASETELPTLWAERRHGHHAWGMTVDLDACTSCAACVVACQAENNVPVVGADQVARTRIMHWMRIDRYYREGNTPQIALHQPMLCQHCGNAPCETVCPVLATSTSSEGLSQQVYNRCIGTRYCANNCPYKARRFNWYNYTDNPEFDFNMANPVGRMVLNPDVTVRSRGVMEKCSMCVQRIQLAKNIALQEKRELADGDIETACQQACPTGAIVFGDRADPSSRVAKLQKDPRAYAVLEDLGTRPSVLYLKKIRDEHKA